MAKLHKIMDTMVGKNLNAHVMGGPIRYAPFDFTDHAVYFRWI